MKLIIKCSNRKGSLLVPFVIFGAIITLIGLLMLVFTKGQSFEKSLGDRQLELFTIYQIGEKYLHFVDESVKLSIRPALLEVSRNGLKKSPDCGKDTGQQYVLWADDSTNSDCNIVPKGCYPSEGDEKSYFVDTFKAEYLPLLQEFNDKKSVLTDFSAKIPKEFTNLKVEKVGDKLELVGIAKDAVSIEKTTDNAPYNLVLRYKVKPSFRAEIGANFLKDGAEIAGKAPQLLRKKEADVRSILGSFNSQNPSLQWALASYSTPGSACSHVIGTCTYKCKCVPVKFACGVDNKDTCTGESCETCTGRDVETVSYKNVTAAFSVANGKSFYVSDPPSSPPQLKGISYDFGLNWLEETGSVTKCVP